MKQAIKRFFAGRKVEKVLEKGLTGDVQKIARAICKGYSGIFQAIGDGVSEMDAAQIDASILGIYQNHKKQVLNIAIAVDEVLPKVEKVFKEVQAIGDQASNLVDSLVEDPNLTVIQDQFNRASKAIENDANHVVEAMESSVERIGNTLKDKVDPDTEPEPTKHKCPECGKFMAQLDRALWECKVCSKVWDVTKNEQVNPEPAHERG